MVKPSTPATPIERFREHARDLLRATAARQLSWVPLPAHARPPETSYELVLPESRVRISYTRPAVHADSVALRLLNTEGVTVDEWTVAEPDDDTETPPVGQPDPNADWHLLTKLFGEVHRQATGYDRVLSDVEKALAALEQHGQSKNP